MSRYIPILMYHNIVETIDETAPDWISSKLFIEQLNYILTRGYTPIRPHALLNRNSLPKKPILITFDDGYENIYHLAYPILKDLNIQFSLFLISSFLGDDQIKMVNNWDQGKRPTAYHLSKKMIHEMLSSNLLTIGAHSHTHRTFNSLTDNEISEEIEKSISTLQHEFTQNITSFSYPGGYTGNSSVTLPLLKKNNITLAFGGQTEKVENLKKINYFNINRINITNDINFTTSKVKFQFKILINPYLNPLSKYNKLNFLIKPLLKFIR